MKVKDMPYEHLTIEEIRQEARAIIDEVKNAMRINYFDDADLIAEQSRKFQGQ